LAAVTEFRELSRQKSSRGGLLGTESTAFSFREPARLSTRHGGLV
jgi:hypothetical protein